MPRPTAHRYQQQREAASAVFMSQQVNQQLRADSIQHDPIRHQSFWNSERCKSREAQARLVNAAIPILLVIFDSYQMRQCLTSVHHPRLFDGKALSRKIEFGSSLRPKYTMLT